MPEKQLASLTNFRGRGTKGSRDKGPHTKIDSLRGFAYIVPSEIKLGFGREGVGVFPMPGYRLNRLKLIRAIRCV
jgi:hypothetical protein